VETTLHRQLKELYADRDAQFEVPVGPFRIDVVCQGVLVEIQHGSLAAIRDKVARLVQDYRVLVVKPVVIRKRITNHAVRGGRVLSSRLSPRRGDLLDLFHELIYFTRVFPHQNLGLEVPLVDVEEVRHPGHGRRRRWRRRDHQVEDQRLLTIHRIHHFRTGGDLAGLLPANLPTPFHSGQLAEGLGVTRWFAQRIAYCLRMMQISEEVGKQGNSRLYRLRCPTEAAA
jgi:hypothetical protein